MKARVPWPWDYTSTGDTGEPYELVSNVRPRTDGVCRVCGRAAACILDDRCDRCGGSHMQYKRGVALPPLPGDWP